MLKVIKTYMMPIAMLIGVLFYAQVAKLAFITPYLIGAMLFFTYSNISFRSIKFSRFHFILLAIQLIGSVTVYLLLLPIHPLLAQGAMICVLAPTATAAPVITGMLGGSVESLTAYSLLCNLTIAFVAPFCFAVVGDMAASSFTDVLFMIAKRISILLLFPFLLAYMFYRLLPSIHVRVRSWKRISFYLWSFALVIITGKTVLFVVEEGSDNYYLEIALAFIAFVICIFQFLLGRYVGRKFGDTISGGQGLGQKNTILAIWMAQTYLNPISSIAPGAYVLWQNMVNSYQVWKARKTL